MDITLALQFCRPGAQWRCGEDYASLQWDDATQTKPTEGELAQAWTDYLAEREKPKPVTTISNAQMRLWLVDYGHYPAVLAFINGIVDPIQRLKAQIEFQSRGTIHITHPLTQAVAAALNLTAEQLQAAFAEAATL